MTDISDALVSLGATFTARGPSYSDVEFLPDSPVTPTEKEVLAEIARLEAYEGTLDDRIDKAFTPTDKDKVIFEALFELSNRVIALEGGNAIDRAQLRNWLKAKLPQ